MPVHDHERISSTSTTLLKPLITALGANDTAIRGPIAGLPAPSLYCPSISTAICATPILAPRMFRSRLVGAACNGDLDVVLVRHGFHPELLDPVSFDVVLHRKPPLDVIIGLVACRTEDGRLWLIPPPDRLGDSVLVDETGLTISARPPLRTLDERSDGVMRAAAETVRALHWMRGA